MWIYIPSTSCRSAPGSEDSISESDWRFQALEQSAWLRGKPLPARSWHRRWTKDRCIQRLSGRMPEPSTVERGLAEFMASLPATPASPSLSQASGEEPKTPGTSGPRSSASLGKWDPNSCSWRTSQATFDWDSIESSVILPKSGSTRNGRLFERPMSELRTDESGSSSWPTAGAMDGHRAGKEEDFEEWKKARDRHAAKGVNKHFHLNAASSKWAAQWPTPRTITGGAESAERKKELGRTQSGGGDLQSAAKQWPTPSAALTNDGEEPETFLARQKKWEGTYHNSVPLTVSAKMHGPQDPTVTGAESPSTSGLRLNPRFVEWLMGFPDEWTVCEHSATPSSQHKQPSPSPSSCGESND